MTGKVCVAVSAADAAGVAEAVGPVLSAVDVIEVRLDGMVRPEVEKCCSLLRLPLLFTNRASWEGGNFSGTEQERLAPLLAAVRLQAAYVDLEVRAERPLREQLLAEIQQSSTRLILSWHDFAGTPKEGELVEILGRMQESGADIGKIITTAHDEADVLRVLALLERAKKIQFPLTAFCMGEIGRISRFATMYLGGAMTYVAVGEDQATAPGQFSAAHFRKLQTLFSHVD